MLIFQAIELLSIILFAIYFVHAYRRDEACLVSTSPNTKFLLLALVYAFVFENLSVVFFAGAKGGYYYNDNFLFFIYKTPLFIVLLWSVILYSSYNIIKKITSKKQILFLMPLYVLALDIVMDVIAVRMGLWTWIGFARYNGFFSVPASNYIGWLLTSFFFVFTWEKLKDKGKLLYLQPFLAYLLFIFSILPLYFLKINFFDDNLWMQYGVLFILIIIFITLFISKNKKTKKSDIKKEYILFSVRGFIYIFSLLGIIFLDLYNNLLILFALGLVLFFEYIVFKKYSLFGK